MSIQGNINQIISMAGMISKLSPEHATKIQEKQALKEDAKRAREYGESAIALNTEIGTYNKIDKPAAQARAAGANKALSNLTSNYANYLISRGDYQSAARVYSQQGMRDYANKQAADQIEQKRMQKENYMKGRTMLNDFESWTKERGM